jgi:hypothetical protein
MNNAEKTRLITREAKKRMFAVIKIDLALLERRGGIFSASHLISAQPVRIKGEE